MPLPAHFARPVIAIYERYGRHLPAIASAILVILVARAAADLAWAMIPAPDGAAWTPPPPAAATAGGPQRGAGVDTALILNARLFGDYRPAEPSATALMDAPETKLNLTLMGIFAAASDDESRALIASSDGQEEPYAVGDDVTRGVQLQAIFPDRVILSRDGRLETLRLERDKAAAGGGPVAQAGPAETAPGENAAGGSLASIREEVLKDPAKAQDYVRVQPANIGGQLRGYRIYPGRDRSIFSAAGLRPGDLVTAVNGVELNDPARALQLIGEMSTVSQLTLTVERAGQTQTIDVNLN